MKLADSRALREEPPFPATYPERSRAALTQLAMIVKMFVCSLYSSTVITILKTLVSGTLPTQQSLKDHCSFVCHSISRRLPCFKFNPADVSQTSTIAALSP